MNVKHFEVKDLPEKYDHIAPDGSEIRPLVITERCTIGHCTLHSGRTSQAHKHKTVDEIWYFIQGEGKV
jgi:mannose-6-phosphate isomerase-like protein (cupin superfamily)